MQLWLVTPAVSSAWKCTVHARGMLNKSNKWLMTWCWHLSADDKSQLRIVRSNEGEKVSGKEDENGRNSHKLSSRSLQVLQHWTDLLRSEPRATRFRPGGATTKETINYDFTPPSFPLFLSLLPNKYDGWVISVSQKHERLSGVLWCPTAWISCLVLWWCAWNPDELTYCSSHSIQHGGPLNTLHIRFNTLVFALIASVFYFTLLKAIPHRAMAKAITKKILYLFHFTSWCSSKAFDTCTTCLNYF